MNRRCRVSPARRTWRVAGSDLASATNKPCGPRLRTCRSSRTLLRVDAPETRYARSGEFSIAYQTVGEGVPDLVWIPASRTISSSPPRPSASVPVTRCASEAVAHTRLGSQTSRATQRPTKRPARAGGSSSVSLRTSALRTTLGRAAISGTTRKVGGRPWHA